LQVFSEGNNGRWNVTLSRLMRSKPAPPPVLRPRRVKVVSSTSSNPLFEGWEHNICKPWKPLGQWTRQAKEEAGQKNRYIEDEEDDE
jgi:hypothetical protein